jgi:hypothetical protein
MKGWHVRRKTLGAAVYLLAAGAILLLSASASASQVYTSAEIEVFSSTGTVLATTGLISEATAAAGGPGGALYAVPGTAFADAGADGNFNSLSTGANPNGPYFVSYGVFDVGAPAAGPIELAFSWDPNGNDPYGQFASVYSDYVNPPTLPQYTFDMTNFLSIADQAAGDTAELILNTNVSVAATPEPGTLVLLTSGGFVLTAFGARRRRRRLAGA